jgi:phenylacetaldehyde dehydrogenase
VKGFLEAGRAEGAAGGKFHGNQGYFVEPTVLARTDRSMKVVREEIFGPVVRVQSFHDADLGAGANSPTTPNIACLRACGRAI